MPTYEFTCKECQHHFNVFTTVSKKNKIVCPECGGKKFRETFGVFYVGGNLSQPSAGSGENCSGTCTSCSSTCSH
jgi:putative FmdB family regulatory protein